MPLHEKIVIVLCILGFVLGVINSILMVRYSGSEVKLKLFLWNYLLPTCFRKRLWGTWVYQWVNDD